MKLSHTPIIYILLTFALITLINVAVYFLYSFSSGSFAKAVVYRSNNLQDKNNPSSAVLVRSPFHYRFLIDDTLNESGAMSDTSSPYWWLNSGGLMHLSNGVGMTIQGALPRLNKWRLAYKVSNPIDTDNGYHPQNIFRLVTRSTWENFKQEVYFNISKINLSQSIQRNAWSGFLLFNRYRDGDTLYYTGIRVDGSAIIKKKTNGVYYTLAEEAVYPGAYDRFANPNVIPLHQWIGLRSEIITNQDSTVSIAVYMDKEKNNTWELVAYAIDDGITYGGEVISGEGYAGIRTDFMDVLFDDYRIISPVYGLRQ